MNISLFGLGRLGTPMAAVLASKGHQVVGMDVNQQVVDLVNSGQTPVDEPGVQALIEQNHSRLRATTDYDEAVSDSEVSFIVVPTPSESDGSFSLMYVLEAVRGIGNAVLRTSRASHLVVVTSTVSPGSSGGPIREALERSARSPLSERLGLCYSPEFIALGTVIRDILHPDMILIGQADERSGAQLEELSLTVTDTDTPVVRLNLVNAELAKLAVNTFVTTKISYANMLSQICEQIPGADATAVTEAVGHDSRIGHKYLRPATPYGGPCFPRDNAAMAAAARAVGARADLAEATDTINRRELELLAQKVLDNAAGERRIGILGLSYKPGSSVTDVSTGVALARYLVDRGLRPVVYDPAAMGNAMKELADSVSYAASIEECLKEVDVAVLTVAWPQFREISPELLRNTPVVIDCWRILAASEHPLVEIICPGRGPSDVATPRATFPVEKDPHV
jgi:UDPglucose 6-dehydrogenase